MLRAYAPGSAIYEHAWPQQAQTACCLEPKYGKPMPVCSQSPGRHTLASVSNLPAAKAARTAPGN